MTSPEETDAIVAATRTAAGLFERPDRGLLEVRGEDRVRWLDGMISGDVAALTDAPSGAGCYATLLTNRGAIVADLHVGRLGDAFYLESRRDRIESIRATLDRFIIADDVELIDRTADWTSVGLEGPKAREILAGVLGQPLELDAEGWVEVEIAGRPVVLAAFGWTGEDGFQVHLAAADRENVVAALERAGEGLGLVRGDAAALEVLRVEAGVPALGPELSEDVLPAEARLERAIATDKGCYVGQEIVARLRARGKVNHLLVGLRIEADELPPVDTSLTVDGKRTGEVTSTARSPRHGPIALGYVRREHSEPDTRLEFEGGAARVAALPFDRDASPGSSV